MTRTIGVLIVDDSPSIRSLIRKALEKERDLEVVATAANGKKALDRIANYPVDIVILDVNMPEMNGIEMLKELRKTNEELPVIMFSELTGKGSKVTMDALMNGASDYITKTTGANSPVEAIESFNKALVPKIRSLCQPRPRRARKTVSDNGLPKLFVRAVVIASSTGGPPALQRVVADLPDKPNVPIFIVQHMPPMFTAELAHQLTVKCGKDVREAKDGDVVKPGVIWVAPGDYHIELERLDNKTVIRTHQGPEENSVRPAADVLFRSAAGLYGRNLLCAILTGMGADGTKGAQVVKAAGGYVVVQDEKTSKVWGMPGAAVRAGCVDDVLPLNRIGGYLGDLIHSKFDKRAS